MDKRWCQRKILRYEIKHSLLNNSYEFYKSTKNALLNVKAYIPEMPHMSSMCIHNDLTSSKTLFFFLSFKILFKDTVTILKTQTRFIETQPFIFNF